MNAVPALPDIRPDEIWPGTPNVLVDEGKYTIGWQKSKGDPCFVTLRRGALGSVKVVERYPMTEDGWSRAWRALVELDPATADAARVVLETRAHRARIEAATIVHLPYVVYVGGSTDLLTVGQECALRFLHDRIAISPVRLELEYTRVQALEATGQIENRLTAGQVLLLGYAAAAGTTRTKTFLRIQIPEGELFFLHTSLPPENLRIRLSPVIARLSASTTASLVDELTRLAALLDKGLLTRQEFDQLKARLLAGQ